MNRSIFTGLTLVAAIAGCDGASDNTQTAPAKDAPAAAEDAGDTLATVNGLSVGSKEFEAAAARKVPKEGSSLSLDEKKEVLDRLVDEKLLYQAALDQGLDKDPKVQKVMVNTLLREAVYANVRNSDFTDEDLQQYFDQNKDDFVVPEKVQIKRILIKVSDDRSDADAKSEAERIRGEIVSNPSSFKELATKHSEDPYKRRGGDVGFVPKSGKPGLDQSVVDKAFTLGVDDVSDVFKTDEGYNVVTVANKRERVERTFQQMKGSVLRKVKNEKLKNLYESYVDNLRKGAKISTDEGNLDSITVKAAPKPKAPGFGFGPPGGKPASAGGPGVHKKGAPGKIPAPRQQQ